MCSLVVQAGVMHKHLHIAAIYMNVHLGFMMV